LEINYLELVGKYKQLRDFTELKNSRNKLKVEVNLEFVLEEIK
jgi:hypothetical protein